MKKTKNQKAIYMDIDFSAVDNFIVAISNFVYNQPLLDSRSPEEKALAYLMLTRLCLSDLIKECGITFGDEQTAIKQIQDSLESYFSSFVKYTQEFLTNENKDTENDNKEVSVKKGRFLN